jgi:hypothetical protein
MKARHGRTTCCVWTLTGLAVALLVSGCDLVSLGDDTGNAQTPDQNTPTNTGGNGGGGGSAQCAVTSNSAPQGVPAQALSVADDTLAGYGDALNTFWAKQLKSDACLYRADPTLYPQVQQNAISYSYPPVVIYDPSLFQRFTTQWSCELPTRLILAHEWGHQVQYAAGAQYQTTFEYEQDADQRAGYYMGTQAQLDGSANVEQVASLLKEFACSIGDPDSIPWFTQGAHGSCQQRADAVITGFNQAVQTSTVGLGALSRPDEAAPTAGHWTGSINMHVTVVDEDHISVSQQNEPYDYEVTIADDGKVSDEQGNGPLPDIGGQQIIPVHTTVYDFDIVSTTTKFSYDDHATRYEADLSVTEGTVSDVPVTGDGFSVDVYNLLSDGSMNVYLYDSITLTTGTGITLTVVIETTGTLNRAD